MNCEFEMDNVRVCRHTPYINIPTNLIDTQLNNGYTKVHLPLAEFDGFSLVYIPTSDIHIKDNRAYIDLPNPTYYVYPKDCAKAKMDGYDLALSFKSSRNAYFGSKSSDLAVLLLLFLKLMR